jgi:hypothetical protein
VQAERMMNNGTDDEEWFRFDVKVIWSVNCWLESGDDL